MRSIAATLLLILTGAVVAADDIPPIKAGLPRGGDKKATAPAPRPADDKKADAKKDDKKAPARKELSREDRLKAAKDGYNSYCANWVDALRRADDEKQKESLLKNLPNPGLYAGSAARLVLDNPKDEVAFDALQWLVRYKDVPQVKKVLAAVPAGEEGREAGPAGRARDADRTPHRQPEARQPLPRHLGILNRERGAARSGVREGNRRRKSAVSPGPNSRRCSTASPKTSRCRIACGSNSSRRPSRS